jgi:hypothetical protein
MEALAFVIAGFVVLLLLDALAMAFGHDSREAFDDDVPGDVRSFATGPSI